MNEADERLRPAISHVGIWERKDGPGGREFVRDRKHFFYWRSAADVERIPPKTTKKRVVLLGESTARGLYYDPAHTPAMALQSALDQMGESCEVVDLAIAAMRPRHLLGLIRELPAIQPDVVVLFGGNNWHWEFDQDSAAGEDATALAEAFGRGVEHYKEEFDRRCIGGISERILGALAGTARELGIPAVIVVPEFNLADWRDDLPLPLLKSGSAGEWHRLRAEADAACEGAQWEKVERLASRMQAVDHGLAPHASRLLARVAMARGSPAEARAHLEAAKDSVGGLPYLSCPRCLSTTQAVLRSAEKRFDMAVVDLPRLLARDGDIPGRMYFMDYCHMTAQGIGIAMQAAAAAVSGVLSPGAGSRSPARIALPEPDPAVAAVAHVLASIHNSILGQPPEVVAHHLREALRLEVGTASRLLAAFLCARASEFPDWLNEDLALACSQSNARRHLIRTIHASEGRHFPSSLLDSARDLLPEAWMISCRQAIAREIAVSRQSRRIDLLEPGFQQASLHLRRAAYLAEKDRRTEFRFFCPEASEMKIRLCCRTPGAVDPAQVVTISFGSNPVWSGHVGAAWKDLEIGFRGVPPADGVGTLTLEWPDVSADSTAAWKSAQESLDRGEAPDVYLTFGEIHSLVLEW
jgi:hypothetical protein